MKRREGFGGAASGLFTLLLLCLLAIFSVMLVISGVQVYKGAVERSELHGEKRILRAIVRSAVWADDARDTIFIEELDGHRTISIIYDVDGEEYIKRLYQNDGYLCESLMSAAHEFDPSHGETICAAEEFDPSLEDGLLTVRITQSDGSDCTVHVALRTED